MKWITTSLFAAALFVAQAATETHAQTWALYKPAGVGYSIEMPAEWTVTAADIPSQLGPVKTATAEVKLASEFYITMYTIYPAEVMAGQSVTTILDRGRDAAVSNVKGTVRSEETVSVSDLPGRQIVVDAPGDLVVVVRFFLKDNVMIQAIVAGHPGIELQPKTVRFLESMKTVIAQ